MKDSNGDEKMDFTVTNAAEIRQNNKKKILHYLVEHDGISKKEIERQTELSAATVSNLCNQLMQDGFLSVASLQKSSGGRNASLLTVQNNHKYYLALRIIDETMVDVALLSFDKVIARNFFVKAAEVTMQGILNAWVEGISKCLDGIEEDSEILGIGAALPGIVDFGKGILLNSTIPFLEGEDVIGGLQKIFPDYFIVGENESNLLARATSKSYCQSSLSLRDSIYLHVDEGLGIGIVCNGMLATGYHNRGGEISHLPIGEKNRLCACGQRGCIEMELSIGGILADYEEQEGVNLSWDDFSRMVKGHDAKISKIVAEKGRLMGKLIAVLDALFDPYAFYIGGRGVELFEEISSYVKEVCTQRQNIDKAKNVLIRPCYEYDELLLKGCADLVFDLFSVQE